MTETFDRDCAPLEAARVLLDAAATAYRKQPDCAETIRAHRQRLDEPLRIAIVGSVKAGKSTLLNAMLGQHLAPTDARECTKVVTWYRHGTVSRIDAVGVDGTITRLPVVRQQERLELELGDLEADDLQRLEIRWPAGALSELILIDTPGTASISATVSRRTQEFLAPRDDVSGVDAVIYMLRSLHSSDVDFLQQLRHRQGGQERSAIGSIAVLSRADELGGGRLDAMVSVNRAVRSMRADPALEGLVEAIVPVAGLLALAGATLRQSEYAAFVALEKVPRDRMRSLLLSADRFIAESDEKGELPSARVRSQLVRRFGLYGIRLAVATMRGGVRDAPALSRELVRRSGVEDLLAVVDTTLRHRQDELKAHSAIVAVRRLLTEHPHPATAPLLDVALDYLDNSQAFAEMHVLSQVRAASLVMPSQTQDEVVRLLGGEGTTAAQRLALPEQATHADIGEAALATLRRWVAIGADPLTTPEVSAACRVVIRSCEGIVDRLSPVLQDR